MNNELRPTPILKGKAAERFYRCINNGKMTEAQKKFLNQCADLLDESNI